MGEFYQTIMGQRFFEATVPALVKQLERLNNTLEVQNELKEKKRQLELEKESEELAKAKRIKEIEARRRNYAVIGFDGIDYEADYIADHINEFQEALMDGVGPFEFERHCNVSDALGHYCDICDYHGIYQILLRIYDDEDQIDEILLNLKPDSEEAQLIRERYQEEIVDGE